MDNLGYNELKLQTYLKSKNIPVYEAKNIYKFRVRVADFKDNFKGKYADRVCPFCQLSSDTQAHSLQCDQVKLKVKIEGNYTDICKEIIPENL